MSVRLRDLRLRMRRLGGERLRRRMAETELRRAYHRLGNEALERRRLEHALRRSRSRCRALLAAIPGTILAVRADGTVVDGCAGRPGGPHRAVPAAAGRPLDELMPREDGRRMRKVVQRVLRTGRAEPISFRCLADTGNRELQGQAVPIGQDEVALIADDPSQKLTEPRAAAPAVTSEQIGSITHEMNNAIGAILLAARTAQKVLGRAEAGAVLERCLDAAGRHAVRCGALVKRLRQAAGREPAPAPRPAEEA